MNFDSHCISWGNNVRAAGVVAAASRLVAAMLVLFLGSSARAFDPAETDLDGEPRLIRHELPAPADYFREPELTEGVFEEDLAGSAELGDLELDEPDEVFSWQVLPTGLMYRSYLAGEKEPRFQFVALSDRDRGMVWETALGGRAGLLRYGTRDLFRPEGWQLDLEGAVLARVLPEENDDLGAADFRAGFLSTWRGGPDAYKVGYYHLSSHLGDEFLIKNPDYERVNYVRDSLIIGWTRDLTLATQFYAEVGYAFGHTGGAEPLEFQTGLQYSPLIPTDIIGAPFAAVNVHVREDFDYITAVNVVAGWQWRGGDAGQRFRVGFEFYDGPSMQYSLVGVQETLLGGGIWYDF